jgi:hypothetical protein
MSADKAERQHFYQAAMGYLLSRGKKPGAAFYMTQERYPGFKPPFEWRELEPVEPTQAEHRWIKSRNIRWAKGRERTQGVDFKSTLLCVTAPRDGAPFKRTRSAVERPRRARRGQAEKSPLRLIVFWTMHRAPCKLDHVSMKRRDKKPRHRDFSLRSREHAPDRHPTDRYRVPARPLAWTENPGLAGESTAG